MSPANRPLVSVVMPAYNAAPYIGEAVASVIAQTWTHWELIVVDDGSMDGTAAIVRGFDDPRITLVCQENRGVSAARNLALGLARGEHLTFLDADDMLTPQGLEARVDVLARDPGTCFADGPVHRLDHRTGAVRPMYRPTFRGMPFPKLMALDGACFFGPSWMVRRVPATDERFPEHMRHAEDLAWYLSIARAGTYDHTDVPVLIYRSGHGSAMSDLDGLWRGYRELHRFAQGLEPAPSQDELRGMRSRIRRVMALGFLKAGRPLSALRAWLWDPARGPNTPA